MSYIIKLRGQYGHKNHLIAPIILLLEKGVVLGPYYTSLSMSNG